MWLYIKVSHHPAGLGGRKHCGSGDVMVLVWSAILQDQSTIWRYGLEPLKLSHQLAKLGDHRHCGCGDIMILVCHVISQDHVIKGSCDLMNGSPWC